MDHLYTARRSLRMIVRLKALASRRLPPSPTERIVMVVSQRVVIWIFMGLILVSIFVPLLVSISMVNEIDCATVDSMIEIFNCRKGQHVDQVGDRVFPRVVTYSQHDVVALKGWKFTKRNVIDMGNAKARARIVVRDELDLDNVEDEHCKLQYHWQKTSFPTCNMVHEFNGNAPWSHMGNRRHKLYRVIGHGFWRDVWVVNYDHGVRDEKGILKTMRYRHDYTPRNLDRMRRDAVAMERLTKSNFIVNVYSFCGTTSFSEFGDGGDILDALWFSKNGTVLSQIQKLRIGAY
jgi:hypothetical protein